MKIRIEPHRLFGTVEAIPSKSHVHRLMIANFLAGGEPLKIGHMSRDMKATAACIEALKQSEAPVLNCDESGSTARFLLPVAAALKGASRFTGTGRLPGRPFEDLCVAMESHGVTFNSHHLPMQITGRMTSGVYEIPGNVSSQYISGLLFALPLLEGRSSIVLTAPLESRGYVDMTCQVLRSFGIEIIETGGGFTVPGGQSYILPGKIEPEGDWSNSAFWLAAGVKVTGLDIRSPQGDKAILKIIEEAKCPGEFKVDVADIPDLVPITAVIGAARRGRTVIENAGRLRIKESDRLHTVCKMIQSLGGTAIEQENSIVIEGSGSLTGGTVDSCNDHRIAMAAAIASIICTEPVYICDAQAVEKSYPEFFEDFKKLGGVADVV
jgi:3-phosphoshikimate 1-carboxyvinyltransferase